MTERHSNGRETNTRRKTQATQTRPLRVSCESPGGRPIFSSLVICGVRQPVDQALPSLLLPFLPLPF